MRALAEAYGRHRGELGARLVEAHDLESESAATLLERLQTTVGCMNAHGADLEVAITKAVTTRLWREALHGLGRLEAAQRGTLPPVRWGQVAVCLHNLGRYDEASDAVARGVATPGADGRPLAESLPRPPEPPPEDALVARWGGALTPRVTIICMTFNHVRYVSDTLRGFLAQETDFPFEVIIHDDASTDGTADVLRAWAARYPRIIRLIAREKNLYSTGVYPITTLPGLPRGELIATCEGDDYWTHPGKLAKQANFLFENPEFSCSGHNYLHFHEGLLTANVWLPGRSDLVITGRELANLSKLRWMPWTLTMMYRAECFRFPPERSFASLGDQFLMSTLGRRGPCMYFEGFIAAVRRENAFSAWSPLSAEGKEKVRLRTWMAIMAFHARRGNRDPVEHMIARLLDSKLPLPAKVELYTDFVMKLGDLPPVGEV